MINIYKELFKLLQSAACFVFALALVFGMGSKFLTPNEIIVYSIVATAAFFTGFGVIAHRIALFYRLAHNDRH